jgi:hypothetical protein
MAGLITPISTKKKTKRRGAQAFCLLVMVGLTTPKSREENKKKSKKAPPLLVSLPCPTALRNIEKKENK